MANSDQFWRDYRKRCESEIAQLEETLQDWSDGSMTFQSRKSGETEWTDQKPSMIEHLKRSIVMYREIIERIDTDQLA